MLGTLTLIFPLIFIVLIGFGCARLKFLNQDNLAGVSRFIFYVCIPAFLFLNMQGAELTEVVSLGLLASFYLPVLSVYLSVLLVFRLINKQWAKSAVLALGASYSNTVLIGLPIAIQALGKEVAATVFVIITFHSALLFLLTYAFCGKSQNLNWRTTARQLIINPVILPISLGVLANVAGLKLFAPIEQGLSLLGDPAIAGALFVLGANLHHYRIKSGLKLALILSLVKILLLPAAVWLCATYLFILPTEQTLLLVLISSAPLGVNAYLVAKELNTHNDILASSVVLSTVLSAFSYVLWLNWV
ncbi:AEC family transporter [Pseudoalteromonas sp. YIC-656]|uniref:AEC family transporter n=1 Tax=Pseudoalteromonas pernae TaxID=3118054 RepID=UPI0032420F4D